MNIYHTVNLDEISIYGFVDSGDFVTFKNFSILLSYALYNICFPLIPYITDSNTFGCIVLVAKEAVVDFACVTLLLH